MRKYTGCGDRRKLIWLPQWLRLIGPYRALSIVVAVDYFEWLILFLLPGLYFGGYILVFLAALAWDLAVVL